MKRILFVCTGNTCRSPMAMGIANFLFAENNLDIVALSAGIMTNKAPVSKHSQDILKEFNVDLSSYMSTQIDPELVAECDLVLTMTNSHKNLIYNMGNNIHTLKEYVGNTESVDIIDPFGGDFKAYKSCFNEIIACVDLLIEKIKSN